MNSDNRWKAMVDVLIKRSDRWLRRAFAANQRATKILTAAHDAADELDMWDPVPASSLGGCSPGGVVRHAVHEAAGVDIYDCPTCQARAGAFH